ncbi:acetate/propionate family kinase [Buchnera aphidicola]|uniref:acetate/propionate family kinase n=1 Tax=Buchnera aphidicola TaxID=9 RepID=UPI0031B69E2D
MKKKKILVLNCGSSTIKFSIFDVEEKIFCLIGIIDNLGTKNVCAIWKIFNNSEEKFFFQKNLSYEKSLKFIFELLKNKFFEYYRNIIGIGHRVVHGGDKIFKTEQITSKILKQIKLSINFAPLHNPKNILGIESSLKFFPHLSLCNFAVFDTMFHQTIPKVSFLYAIPYFFYKNYKIRRYGAHGINHFYVTKKSALLLKKNINTINLISCHLGSGASITAIRNGKSIDTSMGLTPLEGLIMGTRCGDIDPSIIFYMYEILGFSILKIKKILTYKSGLLGISELSSDFRILEKQYNINMKIKFAIKSFCYRISKYISSYMVALKGKLHALIFTGGIGENSSFIRKKIIKKIHFLGFKLDVVKNVKRNFLYYHSIHKKNSIPIFVIRANEEKMIAEETLRFL